MSKKILHLPYNQGNISTCLRVGEQAFKAQSTLASAPNIYAENSDITLSVAPWLSWRSVGVFINALQMNVLLFNYGSSLIDPPWRKHFLLDLPFYPKRIKKAMIFQGSDSRIAYPEAVLESREMEKTLGYTLSRTTADGLIPEAQIERKLARINKISSYVDRVFYVNPDLAAALGDDAEFMPYPVLLPPSSASSSVASRKPMRVLHLSTNRVLKGTGLIEAALKQAQKHANIETRILVKTTRAKAIEGIEWADVVIDQMCLGWYGMQAVEALARGKPVLCWLKDEDVLRNLPKYQNMPSGFINVTHDKIAQAIVSLADNPEKRQALSIAGTGFVRDIHDPFTVVKNAYGDWL